MLAFWPRALGGGAARLSGGAAGVKGVKGICLGDLRFAMDDYIGVQRRSSLGGARAGVCGLCLPSWPSGSSWFKRDCRAALAMTGEPLSGASPQSAVLG
jgi:hypothetical protein